MYLQGPCWNGGYFKNGACQCPYNFAGVLCERYLQGIFLSLRRIYIYMPLRGMKWLLRVFPFREDSFIREVKQFYLPRKCIHSP